MAINIKFDLINNPEPPTLILANRNGNKLGQLDVNPESVELIAKFNEASEISFTVNKYVDGKITNLWDKILDFKLVYCKEWDCWFEAKVELDEATESVKTVFCTQLGQAELSQIMLYDIEINTEDDIARDDYKIGILYDPIDSQCILRRLLDKAPHYSIIHVDETIKNIQRSFSFNDISIYDAFQEIAEEIGCLFVFNSDSDANGMPQRTISVYDLQQNCNDCGYRGEFTDACPNLKCPSKQDGYQSKGITYGYGEDTRIFVTSDELASEGIELVTDTDSVKNCFKLEAGDDLMTATVRNRNPNGTDYIWYFSEATKEDMPKELVDKIEEYDKTYQYFYNDFPSFLDDNLLAKYNSLVDKYSVYYNDDDNKLEKISSKIIGFADLMQAYYNTIDLGWYLKSGLMPKVTMGKTDAEERGVLLALTLPPIIAVTNLRIVSKATADSTVLSMARAIVGSAYKVSIGSSQLSGNSWSGNFIITSYSDEKDTYTTGTTSRTLTDFDETYIRQKIEKVLSKENTDDLSITGLFAKDYDEFCLELKKYALTPLTSFHDACQACIDILIEQGAGSKDSQGYLETGVQGSLYNQLYIPYFNKLKAIELEMAIRENEVKIILGEYDEYGRLTKDGLQTNIEKLKIIIQDSLNFQNYLGNDLWLQFCAYRREDKYSNSNYISDGLNNAELFDRALEFYKVAENEIFKSAELQHSISATLNNLLAIPKFKSLAESFAVGNWIRVRIDERVYKLRLVEYEISYGDFNNISVKFSDVAKTKNGYSDLEDILSNASSMASSYDSIKRQANLGNEARDVIQQWLTDGLDASLYNIKNNTNENITIDNNGLIGRSKSDITEEDSPEQIRLTHNIIAYTDDSWNSVKQAIGKHKHMYYDYGKKEFTEAIDYGMSADFVTAGYITGSQIIGGNIISSNYVPEKSGTYFNLIDGDFEIAGGKFIYDAKDNALKLKDVTIQWGGSTNAPEIKDITGLEEYLDEIANLEDQLDGRIQTYSQTNDPSEKWTQEEYDYHIGDLWINPDDGITKRWTGSSWVVVTDSDLQKLAQSKAQIFTSTPLPPYYIGDLWVQGTSGDILHCIKSNIDGLYSANDWVKSSKYTDDTALNNFINDDYQETIQSLNDSIKNSKSRSWYQEEDPSKTWDTTENHIGDLWYCCDENQNTYIYTEDGWKETNVPKTVFDTIDGKRQIFVVQPTSTDSYDTGDLWILNVDTVVNKVAYKKDTILVANVPGGKRNGYNETDWTPVTTHDGLMALDNSIQAINALNDIGDDSKITPTEKQQIKLLMDNITSEYNDILNQCSKYSIDTLNFAESYKDLKNLTNTITSDLTTTTTPLPSGYPALFTDYYSAKELIVAAIEDASKSYSDSLYAALEEQLEELADDLGQVDGRIQTFYQDSDPSDDWVDYAMHEGDVWVNTSNGATYQWEINESGNTYQWIEIQNEYLTSLAQSKAQIFTEQPTSYAKGDLMIPIETFAVNGVKYLAKEVYTAITSSNVFNNSHWTGLDYTNDDALNDFITNDYGKVIEDIRNDIDGKTDTYYQSTAPHNEYINIDDTNAYNFWIGDLWYDTDTSKTYIYQKIESKELSGKYSYRWEFMNVPKDVFDTIDGIASIYVTIPNNPVIGDLLIPSSDVGGYKPGKVYKYDGSSWNEISYTDDTKAEEALAEAKKGIEAASNALKDAQTYTDDKNGELSKNLTAAYENYTITEVGKLDNAVSTYLGWDGETVIDGKHVISPYLGGGYLNITGVENNIRVLIDPDNLTKNGYVFQVQNGNTSKVVMGVDKDGNAQFNGAINATSLTLGDGVTISTTNIDGLDEYAKIGEIPGVPDNIICSDDVKISSSTSADGITTQSITVGDKTYTSIINGDFVLTNVGLGQDAEGKSYTKISNEGLLTARNALIYGTIYANAGEIGGCTIKDGQLQIGSKNLDENVQNTISDAYWNAALAKNAASSTQATLNNLAPYTYNGTTYIDGTKIMTGTVTASKLQGGIVNLLDNFGTECGTITITNAQTGAYAFDLTSNAAMRLTAEQGSLFLQGGRDNGYGWGNYINLTDSNTIYIGNAQGAGVFAPATDNAYLLGFPNYRWQDVYSASPVINTSDIREKQNVKYDLDVFDNFFFNLKPTQYQFINNSSNRYHVGFISQDVEQALTSNGLTSLDFAGFIKSPIYEEDGTTIKDYSYGLRYGEFIALNTHMIQKLYQRISELESKIIELQN